MDALTQLVQLARPQAGLDLRCQLAGAYAIPHAPAPLGIAPFHLVLAGVCHIETDSGETLVAQAGDFVLFPRGGAHDIHNEGVCRNRVAMRMEHDGMLPLRRSGKGEAEVDLLCGHFDYAHGPSELLFQNLPDPLHVSLLGGGIAAESAPALQVVVDLMRYESALQRPGALAIVTTLSQALFVMALRSHAEAHPEQAGLLALLSDRRLAASAQALLKEPGRPWTIEALGEIASMSRASYARHFRATAGVTVWDFMTRIRMAIACGLLRETRRNAGDIAADVGYQSEAAFGKAFKQVLGVLPGQYRRSFRQAQATQE